MIPNKYSYGIVEVDAGIAGEEMNGFVISILDESAPFDHRLVAEVCADTESRLLDRANLVAEAFNVARIHNRTPNELVELVNSLVAMLAKARDWMRRDYDAFRMPVDVLHVRDQMIDEALKACHQKVPEKTETK